MEWALGHPRPECLWARVGSQWAPPTLHPSQGSLFLVVHDLHPPHTSPWLVTCARFWEARRRQEVTTKKAQEGIFSGTVCACLGPSSLQEARPQSPPGPAPWVPVRYSPTSCPCPCPRGAHPDHTGARGQGRGSGQQGGRNFKEGGRWDLHFCLCARRRLGLCACLP